MRKVNRLKIGVWGAILLFLHVQSFGQTITDTIIGSDSVFITAGAFELNRSNLSSAIVRHYPFNNADRTNKASLVGGINTVPGVRMEERSPGSNRINIRGSSLRSPFGVRNIKMYWNDLPFTDAGGNTYFNQLAINSAATIEIVKGPAGSMYGAGTGGLVLMQAMPVIWKPGVSLEYSGGNFGLHNVLANADFGGKENRNHLSFSHNQSEGYRNQSALRRDNFAWTSRLAFSKKQTLTASLLFTDMFYETPGGLTPAEYAANPMAARPAAGGFPSAEQAKAAIYQQNLLAGISNKQTISNHWTNTTALYGAFAQIKNPAIRNYEQRTEPNLGGRTFFSYTNKQASTSYSWITGVEYQAGFFNTQVSRNKNGNRDSLLTNDDLQFNTGLAFTQVDVGFNEKVFLTGGISINQNKVSITRNSALPIVPQKRSYSNEWAPRIQAKYKWSDAATTQATFSKGFSPPTVGELLPSTGTISTSLEAESGYNYELANSFYFLQQKLRFDVTAFYFKLNNTLVQQRDASGGDYFINAGSTKQKGIETALNYFSFFEKSNWLTAMNVQLSYTYHLFTYNEYKRLGVNYAGKYLPGIPKNTISAIADLQFKKGFYLNITYLFNSSTALNDANTFYAESFHLLGTRVGFKTKFSKKTQVHFFVGADNLLNENYSLGNDINAAANRFYNAAPARNFYGGFSFDWR